MDVLLQIETLCANDGAHLLRTLLMYSCCLTSVHEVLERSLYELPLSGQSRHEWPLIEAVVARRVTFMQPACPISLNTLIRDWIAGGDARGDAASGREFAVRMKEEFDRKKALFEDDSSFIQEVREGHSQAVGMDPDQELRILKLRFTAFKRDFKVRLLNHPPPLPPPPPPPPPRAGIKDGLMRHCQLSIWLNACRHDRESHAC